MAAFLSALQRYTSIRRSLLLACLCYCECASTTTSNFVGQQCGMPGGYTICATRRVYTPETIVAPPSIPATPLAVTCKSADGQKERERERDWESASDATIYERRHQGTTRRPLLQIDVASSSCKNTKSGAKTTEARAAEAAGVRNCECKALLKKGPDTARAAHSVTGFGSRKTRLQG